MWSIQLNPGEKYRLKKKKELQVCRVLKKGCTRGHEDANLGRPDTSFPEKVTLRLKSARWRGAQRPWKQQVLRRQELGAFDDVTGTQANESRHTNLDTRGDQGESQRVAWGRWTSLPMETHWVLSRGLTQSDLHFLSVILASLRRMEEDKPGCGYCSTGGDEG